MASKKMNLWVWMEILFTIEYLQAQTEAQSFHMGNDLAVKTMQIRSAAQTHNYRFPFHAQHSKRSVLDFHPIYIAADLSSAHGGEDGDVLAVKTNHTSNGSSSTAEIQILMAFRAGVTTDPQGALSSWNSNVSHSCDWKGITCSSLPSRHVVAVELAGLQLAGTISPLLGSLPYLKYLDLSNNSFTGGIPAELGNCTSLVSLDLDSNQLSGVIPPSLGKLSRLEILYLWGNQLTGVIPSSLGNCSSLVDLELVKNGLSGMIPDELGNLFKQESLFLWTNQLSGVIPSTLDCEL